METKLILADELCAHYSIETSFINLLQEHGLIVCTVIDQQIYVSDDQLTQLEKFITLHYQLDINVEGVHAIHHLLQRLEDSQREIKRLRSLLQVYTEGA